MQKYFEKIFCGLYRQTHSLPLSLTSPLIPLQRGKRGNFFLAVCVRDVKGLVRSTGAKRTLQQPDPEALGRGTPNGKYKLAIGSRQ